MSVRVLQIPVFLLAVEYTRIQMMWYKCMNQVHTMWATDSRENTANELSLIDNILSCHGSLRGGVFLCHRSRTIPTVKADRRKSGVVKLKRYEWLNCTHKLNKIQWHICSRFECLCGQCLRIAARKQGIQTRWSHFARSENLSQVSIRIELYKWPGMYQSKYLWMKSQHILFLGKNCGPLSYLMLWTICKQPVLCDRFAFLLSRQTMSCRTDL